METQPKSSNANIRAIALYALLAAAFALLVLSLGNPDERADRVIAVIFIILNSFWIPAVYLIGAFGLGRVVRKWVAQLQTRWIIELATGLTITLTLTHALGVLGLLNPITAWMITGLGCLSLLQDRATYTPSIAQSIRRIRVSVPGIAFVLGCVLVVLMSCVPPGISWDSEYGSYDALSYHLELPREWLEAGRIFPSEHNVYSFLPSYIEAAYLHFAHLAGVKPTMPSGLSDMLANEARVAMSTHLFSALLLIISSLAIGALTKRIIELSLPNANPKAPALCAQALMMCTPWLTLVGSLSYNETGVLLLGIGALAVALEQSINPNTRSMLAAFIVAGACSCKPTAIFLLAPAVGVVLLSTTPLRQWLKPIALGLFVGFITLSPWLIRNQVATGSIVFPQGASVFGVAHWTQAQHDVYQAAHHFQGSVAQRLSMLVIPDRAGTDHASTYRGFTNMQWALTPWLGFIGCVVLLLNKKTRTLGQIATLSIALPIVGWLALTHLQSRFLIPIAPPLILAGTIALAVIPNLQLQRTIIAILTSWACLWTAFVVSIQLKSDPFATLVFGTNIYTGEINPEIAPWTSTLNTILEPNETVYLLGDATAFYVRSPLIVNTVYDRWLIQDAIEAHPHTPSKWSASLLDAGVDVVVIGMSEINRFDQSGWLPETIDTNELREWIKSLPEPIYIWNLPQSTEPIRAAYRLRNP